MEENCLTRRTRPNVPFPVIVCDGWDKLTGYVTSQHGIAHKHTPTHRLSSKSQNCLAETSSLLFGQGAQLAHATADMVALSEKLHMLPQAVEKSRETRSIIRQNLFWALGYNVAAVPLAAMGLVPPWGAAIGMSLSSLVVVVNALRLR